MNHFNTMFWFFSLKKPPPRNVVICHSSASSVASFQRHYQIIYRIYNTVLLPLRQVFKYKRWWWDAHLNIGKQILCPAKESRQIWYHNMEKRGFRSKVRKGTEKRFTCSWEIPIRATEILQCAACKRAVQPVTFGLHYTATGARQSVSIEERLSLKGKDAVSLCSSSRRNYKNKFVTKRSSSDLKKRRSVKEVPERGSRHVSRLRFSVVLS